jgi:hypothetical protein
MRALGGRGRFFWESANGKAQPVRCFHHTHAADIILAEGFRDGEGNYMTSEVFRGVWISAEPLDENEGARGDAYLIIDIPDEVFSDWEWVQDVGYREALVPAEILNQYPIRRWTEAEEDEYTEARAVRKWHDYLVRRLQLLLLLRQCGAGMSPESPRKPGSSTSTSGRFSPRSRGSSSWFRMPSDAQFLVAPTGLGDTRRPCDGLVARR